MLNRKGIFLIVFVAIFSSFFAVKMFDRKNQKQIVVPDIKKVLSLANDYGKVNAVTGLRPFLDEINLSLTSFDLNQGSQIPMFNAYGFGGSGVTLSTGVAKEIQGYVAENFDKKDKITVVGAGYIGLVTSFYLAQLGYENIQIVAEYFPPMTDDIIGVNVNTARTCKDNYPSMVNGGWIMPVSVGELSDINKWRHLVSSSQEEWSSLLNTDVCKNLCIFTESIVVSENDADAEFDKSGIKKVNKAMGDNILYPSVKLSNINNVDFESGDIMKKSFNSIEKFSNVIQIGSVDVLKRIVSNLHSKNVQFVSKKLSSPNDLRNLVKDSKLVINASGRGLGAATPELPYATFIKGQLIIASVPVDKLSSEDLERVNRSFWFKNYYLFQRFAEDGNVVEFVLGGTFEKGNDSLENNLDDIKDIFDNWYAFAHRNCEKTDQDCNVRYQNSLDDFRDEFLSSLVM